jgi:hypothetical protein
MVKGIKLSTKERMILKTAIKTEIVVLEKELVASDNLSDFIKERIIDLRNLMSKLS